MSDETRQYRYYLGYEIPGPGGSVGSSWTVATYPQPVNDPSALVEQIKRDRNVAWVRVTEFRPLD